jgi:hypothetical protein
VTHIHVHLLHEAVGFVDGGEGFGRLTDFSIPKCLGDDVKEVLIR